MITRKNEAVMEPAAPCHVGDIATESLETIRLLHELQVSQVELEMQNEQLRKTITEKSEHEAHLRNIIANTPAGYFHIDREGCFLDVNNAWLRMHGYDSKSEVIGKSFRMVQVDSGSTSALAHLAELQRGEPIPFGEFSSRRKDGSVGTHLFSAHPVVHIGEIVGFEWFIIDISEHKKAELALKNSEERYRQLFEMESDSLLILDCESCKIVDVNNSALQMYGYSKQEFLQLSHRDISAEQAVRTCETSHPECLHRKKDGTIFPVEITGSSFVYQGRNVHVSAIRDVSERRRAEKQLFELNERMRTAQEQERLAIARDIHDEVGQDLTLMKLSLEWLECRMSVDSGELCSCVDEMKERLEKLVGKVQKIAADLRPPLLDNMGLTAAIEWHIDEFRKRSGLECFVLINDDVDSLGLNTSTAIMRIVQEGLTNVARHAHATEVSVSLCKRDQNLFLEISDNGCGIMPEQIASAKAYGLMGIQERARICHGNLEIIGNPGCGTTLNITIPLDTGECPR